MSIDEQPMNVYWSGQKSPTSNKYKINYKGTVATASALPATGNKKGDTYNISEDGSDYIWTGTEWDKFGANIYIGATSTTNGIQGIVPPATNSQIYSLLTGGGTWESAEDLGLALDDEVVHLIGNETIGGDKTLTGVCSLTRDFPVFSITNTDTSSGKNCDLRFFHGTLSNRKAIIRYSVGGTFSIACAHNESNSYLDGPSVNLLADGSVKLVSKNASNTKELFAKADGTLTWDGQAIQTASDERVKTPLANVPDEVLDAWEDVNWGQFQYLDAVKKKGESARLHLGLIAQHVMSVFEKHGLDACTYGILCHEEREATEDSKATDLWMVRYAEAQAMETAYQRRRANKLEARIAAIEKMLK